MVGDRDCVESGKRAGKVSISFVYESCCTRGRVYSGEKIYTKMSQRVMC